MIRTTRRLAALAAAASLLLPAGCGIGLREKKLPETGATLEGTVTYGKEKVMVAMVIIQGESGAATAFVGEDGRYKAENVPLGAVKVGVNTAAGKGDFQGKLMAKSQGKGGGPLPKLIDVPAKYFDPTTSGISTTVNKGDNTFNIVIPH
jgi:hypothetical protein